LLPSGNDAAFVLANNYPGGMIGFINAMNKKTAELKLLNTYFIDPAGYDDRNVSTVFDLARLASYGLENAQFRELVKTKNKVVFDESYKVEHQLENLNQLLYLKGVTGVKTGFTEEAGGVLVTSFERNGKTFITVVLKSEDRFWDSRELISKIIENVSFINY